MYASETVMRSERREIYEGKGTNIQHHMKDKPEPKRFRP